MATNKILEIEYTTIPTYCELSAPNKCGQIIIDIDESQWTEGFKRFVSGIVFKIYIKDNNEYIPIRDRSYIWNTGNDLSLVIDEIPDSCYVYVHPIFDEVVKEYKNSDGTYKYPELQNVTDIPIAIYFDDANVKKNDSSEKFVSNTDFKFLITGTEV